MNFRRPHSLALAGKWRRLIPAKIHCPACPVCRVCFPPCSACTERQARRQKFIRALEDFETEIAASMLFLSDLGDLEEIKREWQEDRRRRRGDS